MGGAISLVTPSYNAVFEENTFILLKTTTSATNSNRDSAYSSKSTTKIVVYSEQ